MRTFEDLSVFAQRRKRLSEFCQDSSLVVFSGGETSINSPFRAHSDFIYLTGFEEPDACAVIRPGREPQWTLFVRDKDSELEKWDGPRYGPRGVQEVFDCDQSFSIDELEDRLPQLLSETQEVFYDLGCDPWMDQCFLKARAQVQKSKARTGIYQMPIRDPKEVLAPMRVIKDPLEVQWMRESCLISAQAHNHLMAHIQPGLNERQAQAHLLYSFYNQNAIREGYSSIVASGTNATILHYRANNRDMLDGELLLVDAGAEKNYYTGDITRTYPVNGRFTPVQKELYQGVLDVQENLLALVRPGTSLDQLQTQAIQLLTEKLKTLSLLKGNTQNLIEKKEYKRYYPHLVGHYLGLDVHDVGFVQVKGKTHPLEENMILTIEPGLYIPKHDTSAPKEFRGLGVRIEDNVRVTKEGCEILTQKAFKSVSELESQVGSQVKGV